jgi:hypothetical protein
MITLAPDDPTGSAGGVVENRLESRVEIIARSFDDLHPNLHGHATGLRPSLGAPSSDVTERSPDARIPLHAIFRRVPMVDFVREVVEVTSL